MRPDDLTPPIALVMRQGMIIDDPDERAVHVARERRKAREMRKQGWWKRRVAGGICNYCQQAVTPETATMDHIVPLARGGRSTKGNVVLSCSVCNAQKQLDTPFEMLC